MKSQNPWRRPKAPTLLFSIGRHVGLKSRLFECVLLRIYFIDLTRLFNRPSRWVEKSSQIYKVNSQEDTFKESGMADGISKLVESYSQLLDKELNQDYFDLSSIDISEKGHVSKEPKSKEYLTFDEVYKTYIDSKTFTDIKFKREMETSGEELQIYSDLRKMKEDDFWCRSYHGMAPLEKLTFNDLLCVLDNLQLWKMCIFLW